jgi:hypothetical protein
MKKQSEPNGMNIGQIENFEKVLAQLEGQHSEIGMLSKNKPSDAVSAFKLKFINRVLEEANKILGERYKPFHDFYIFDDEEDLPKNSDVTFMISQYLGCMENLRVDNIDYQADYSGSKRLLTWFWRGTDKMTYAPLKIKDK